jgi:hypothetical protein
MNPDRFHCKFCDEELEEDRSGPFCGECGAERERERIAMIEKLQRIDPNGVYLDALSLNEGYDPLTYEEARSLCAELLQPGIYAQ